MSHLVNDSMIKTRDNLIKQIESLSFEEFNSKPEKDKWSIAQVCHHLVLNELSTVKVIKWGLKESKHAGNVRKNVHLVLDRTKKVQAPEIVEPSSGPFEVQQIIDMLSESRKELLKTIDAIEDLFQLKDKSVKHPVFGALPLDQWVELVYLHEQRHIEQIKEVKA